MKKAVVLLSGGLDSTTTLYIARKQGFKCFCLIFDYGQRQRREINAARRIARIAGSHFHIIRIALPHKGSSLLDRKMSIPRHPVAMLRSDNLIPTTYVPARNIIFLSLALFYAETIKAGVVFIGTHTEDYSGYPDCRPEFYQAFRKVIATGTKSGVEAKGIDIITPLIKKTKAEIILEAVRLGAPLGLTWSCYEAGKVPCGKCDSCYFRAKGFREAGIKDPALPGHLTMNNKIDSKLRQEGRAG